MKKGVICFISLLVLQSCSLFHKTNSMKEIQIDIQKEAEQKATKIIEECTKTSTEEILSSLSNNEQEILMSGPWSDFRIYRSVVNCTAQKMSELFPSIADNSIDKDLEEDMYSFSQKFIDFTTNLYINNKYCGQECNMFRAVPFADLLEIQKQFLITIFEIQIKGIEEKKNGDKKYLTPEEIG